MQLLCCYFYPMLLNFISCWKYACVWICATAHIQWLGFTPQLQCCDLLVTSVVQGLREALYTSVNAIRSFKEENMAMKEKIGFTENRQTEVSQHQEVKLTSLEGSQRKGGLTKSLCQDPWTCWLRRSKSSHIEISSGGIHVILWTWASEWNCHTKRGTGGRRCKRWG